jgi:tetratricopeptide (TPR) repeat protein
MSAQPTSRLLHEAGGIRVFHRPGRTDWTLVVFGPRQERPETHNWWGSLLARREEADVIGIAPGDFDWFPPATMATLLPVIRAAAKPATVVYGFSMGGYGALKYGRSLGARATLALSPQYSIDPADGTTGPRGRAYFDPERHRDMRVTPGDYTDQAIVLWDPHMRADDRHARAIARLPGIRPLMLRLAGHATPAVLAETRQIVPVAEALLSGRTEAAVSLIRAARRASPTVLVAAAALLDAHGHERWAEAARSRIGARRVNAARMIEARARAHARMGRTEAELGALREWVAAEPGDLEPRLRLIETLSEHGRQADAVAAARESIAAGVADERLRHALAEAEAAVAAAAPRGPRPAPRLLHETPGIRLWHWPGEGPATLVVFCPARAAPSGPMNWWGGGQVARLGWNAVAFAAHEGNWYPRDEMAALLPHALAAMAGPRIAYGAAMGGYAALKYGRAVGAAAAIAIAPQFSIDPADMPEDPAGRRFFDARRHAGMAVSEPDLPGLPVVVFDPLLRVDHLQAMRLGSLRGVRVVRLPRAGRTAAGNIAEAGLMGAVFEAALAGDAARTVATLRAVRRASPSLREATAKALEQRGRVAWARALRGVEAEAPARDGTPPSQRAVRPRAEGRYAEVEGAADDGRQALQRAARLRAEGRHEEAVAALRAILAARPKDAEAHALLGEALQQLGQRDEAEAAFRQALAAAPAHRGASLGLALLEAESEPGPRVAALIEALRAAGAPEREWMQVFGRFQAQGVTAAAMQVAEQAARLHPGLVRLRLRLARMRLSAGMVQEGLAELQALVAEVPELPEPWSVLAEALAGQRRAAEAREILARAVAAHPGHAGLAARHAGAMLATRDLALAEREARRAVALAPTEDAGHLVLVDVLRRQQRRREAMEAARAGAEAVPGGAALLMRLGRMMQEGEDHRGAAAAFARAVERVPGLRDAWLGLVGSLMEAGRADEAEAAARRAVQAIPGFTAMQAQLGALVLAHTGEAAAQAALSEAVGEQAPAHALPIAMADAMVRQGRRPEAIAHVQAVIATMPGQRDLEVRLGELLIEADRFEEAAALFTQLTEADPGHAAAWVGLSDAERCRKRIKPALEAYRRAVAAGASGPTLRSLRFRLFGEYEG